MKVLAVLLALAYTCLCVRAENVVCGKGTTSKTVTIEDGKSYSFKTQTGKKYKRNTECTVDYKMGDTCTEMSFACTKFKTNNKDKKKCEKGDTVTITADGKSNVYCKKIKPKVTSSGDMKVVFYSDAKKHSSGAVCTVACTEAASTTTTTATDTTSATNTEAAGSPYIPGTPGGPWSLDELLIVRSKLWRIFADDQASAVYLKLAKTNLPEPEIQDDLAFFPAKILRLSFHDCIRYVDGSGGCDGCLNWSGVGYRFPDQAKLKYKFKMPNIKETNNNGLEYAVEILEEIYTDPNFPPQAPTLSAALKLTGKSRADLWSYAAKVAVEFSIEQNNFQCDHKPADWAGSYIGQSLDCHRSLETPDCKVSLPAEIQFSYGRADCVSTDPIPYKAAKEEVHPNPEASGNSTIDFFKSQFNFTGRETVAIMGGHTIGRMYPSHSLLKYTWTSRGGHMFNNAYYRNIVNKDDFFISHFDKDKCLPIGDATGTLPDTKWVPTMNGFTESGGPMHWIKMHFACPQCTHRPTGFKAAEFDRCCVGKPDNLMCKPDNKTRNDVDDIEGCEEYRFAFGIDEMAINAEIGLYFDFEEENGIPTSCEGFTAFNMENWSKSNKIMSKTRKAWHHGCPLNMRKEPASDEPLSAIIETYADNQATWIEDFVPAFEKMMNNGYSASELTKAVPSWDNVGCYKSDGNQINCSLIGL